MPEKIEKDQFYQVKIGEWTKIIQFVNFNYPPELFFSALSFQMHRIGPASQIDILLVQMDKEVPDKKNLLRLKKKDRIISWKKNRRRIQRLDSIFEIKNCFRHLISYGKYQWEDIVDLLESWVGYLYETEIGVRLHAVAFRDFILIAPSGFGKSHLAFNYPHHLIADEVIYIYNGMIENHFTSIRLKNEGSWVTRYGKRQIFGKKTVPAIVPQFFLGETSFLSVFWGLGLPQHLEFSLTIGSLLGWLKIAKKRIFLILKYRLWTSQQLSRESATQLLTKLNPGN